MKLFRRDFLRLLLLSALATLLLACSQATPTATINPTHTPEPAATDTLNATALPSATPPRVPTEAPSPTDKPTEKPTEEPTPTETPKPVGGYTVDAEGKLTLVDENLKNPEYFSDVFITAWNEANKNSQKPAFEKDDQGNNVATYEFDGQRLIFAKEINGIMVPMMIGLHDKYIMNPNISANAVATAIEASPYKLPDISEDIALKSIDINDSAQMEDLKRRAAAQQQLIDNTSRFLLSQIKLLDQQPGMDVESQGQGDIFISNWKINSQDGTAGNYLTVHTYGGRPNRPNYLAVTHSDGRTQLLLKMENMNKKGQPFYVSLIHDPSLYPFDKYSQFKNLGEMIYILMSPGHNFRIGLGADLEKVVKLTGDKQQSQFYPWYYMLSLAAQDQELIPKLISQKSATVEAGWAKLLTLTSDSVIPGVYEIFIDEHPGQ